MPGSVVVVASSVSAPVHGSRATELSDGPPALEANSVGPSATIQQVAASGGRDRRELGARSRCGSSANVATLLVAGLGDLEVSCGVEREAERNGARLAVDDRRRRELAEAGRRAKTSMSLPLALVVTTQLAAVRV